MVCLIKLSDVVIQILCILTLPELLDLREVYGTGLKSFSSAGLPGFLLGYLIHQYLVVYVNDMLPTTGTF